MSEWMNEGTSREKLEIHKSFAKNADSRNANIIFRFRLFLYLFHKIHYNILHFKIV